MKNHKTKVIHTPVRFFPYMGGVEHSTYHLCKHLIKKGCDVEVVCADEDKSGQNLVDGIKVTRLPYVGKVANTNITPSLPLCLLKKTFDVVHTYMPTPWSADWSVIIAKIKNKKSVISIKNDLKKYGFIDNLISTIYINTLFRLTLSLTDRILIVNSDWKNVFFNTGHVLRNYQRKIEVVPNGIDLSLFSPKKKRVKNTLLFVSILSSTHKFKGLDYLLESISQVKSQIKDIRLVVIGEGSLKNEYIELSKNLKIDKHVKFVGEKKQTELVDYYNKANILILPSVDIEGFGNVLVEALACKTPVITTNIVGLVKDISNSRSGIIVEPKSSTQLSMAIIKLLGNQTLLEKMGDNGRKLVEEKYSWKKVADKVNNVYKEITI